MKKLSVIFMTLALFMFSGNLVADLRVTEVMYTSSHSVGHDPDPPQHNYWWELTNFGSSDISLDGYSWDDNSNIAGQFIFPDVTIGAGESIIILEKYNLNETPDVTGFISEWNTSQNNNVNGVQILTSDSFGVPYLPGFGVGGQLYLYDPSYALVDSTSALTSATGISKNILFDGSPQDSIPGQLGAWQAAAGDFGSPGLVPEPATVSLLSVGSLSILRRGKRRWLLRE